MSQEKENAASPVERPAAAPIDEPLWDSKGNVIHAAVDRLGEARAAAPSPADERAARLDDADIDTIAESMPGGLDSFIKQWGWRQFARAVEDEVILNVARAASANETADERAADTPNERIVIGKVPTGPSLTNPLTPYGMLVRALRIVSGTTLMDMAKALLTTPANLSAMEFGRAPVTPEFAFDVAAYFDALGVPCTEYALRAAARAQGGDHE